MGENGKQWSDAGYILTLETMGWEPWKRWCTKSKLKLGEECKNRLKRASKWSLAEPMWRNVFFRSFLLALSADRWWADHLFCSLVSNTFEPTTQVAEAGRSLNWRPAGLHSEFQETLSQKKKKLFGLLNTFVGNIVGNESSSSCSTWVYFNARYSINAWYLQSQLRRLKSEDRDFWKAWALQ